MLVDRNGDWNGHLHAVQELLPISEVRLSHGGAGQAIPPPPPPPTPPTLILLPPPPPHTNVLPLPYSAPPPPTTTHTSPPPHPNIWPHPLTKKLPAFILFMTFGQVYLGHPHQLLLSYEYNNIICIIYKNKPNTQTL